VNVSPIYPARGRTGWVLTLHLRSLGNYICQITSD